MNKYQYWQDALAGKKPPIINEQPECGFYRMKRGNRWIPVAVWPANTGLGFKFGNEVVEFGTEQWPWYAAHPITEAEYRKVAEQGGDWSDADPVVAAMTNNNLSEYKKAIGQDAKAPADPTEEFREQITTALAGVDTYAKIASDEANARATGLRNMLNELIRNGDKAREAEKAPFLDAGRKVDAKWQPLIKQAREGVHTLKEASDAWEDDKRDAARKAAARAAEIARQNEAEGRATPGTSSGSGFPQSNLPPPTTQIRPTYGRAAHVGSRMIVTSVDWDRMIAALKPRPEWPTVQEFLRELAQKLANKGVILDGVSCEERANTK